MSVLETWNFFNSTQYKKIDVYKLIKVRLIETP